MKRKICILLALALTLTTLLCAAYAAGFSAWREGDDICWSIEGFDDLPYTIVFPDGTDLRWNRATGRARCSEGGTVSTDRFGSATVGANHEHDFTSGNKETVTEATCTEDGSENWYCSCGEPDPANPHIVPALGHDPQPYEDKVEATCTTDGKEATQKCSRCGEITGGETIPATGHSWEHFDVNDPANQTAENGWVVDIPAGEGKPGSGHFVCQNGDEAESDSVEIPAIEPEPTKKPSNNKPSSGSSGSGSGSSKPAATAAPELPYGDIVSDVNRDNKLYTSETVEGALGAKDVLEITADADADGKFTLRNLHITDAFLNQVQGEAITTVRFIVGDATVEFPVASFTGDAVATIKGDLDSDVTAFLITIDPNATTADGQPGVSVASTVVTVDGAEYDITPLIPGITLTIDGGAAQPVNSAAVYTAAAAA